MTLPRITPMPLERRSIYPDWIFKPKLDGFRAVAYVEEGVSRLV